MTRHLLGVVQIILVLLLAPSSVLAGPEWNDVVGIFSANDKYRLDIGTRAMKENVPASHDSWATRFVIKRLDGPSVGPVLPNHVVGIFTENGQYRLDIGKRSMKGKGPASHSSWATRLRIVPLNNLALGPIEYGTVIGVFSENGQYRLDISNRAVKKSVPASHDSWATRLRIRN